MSGLLFLAIVVGLVLVVLSAALKPRPRGYRAVPADPNKAPRKTPPLPPTPSRGGATTAR